MSTTRFEALHTYDRGCLDRSKLDEHLHMDEERLTCALMQELEMPRGMVERVQRQAKAWVSSIRTTRVEDAMGLDAFLLRYDLTSEEGIALMCLAEAMLRVPDSGTMDDLISDKLSPLDWANEPDNTSSLTMSIASWSLALTGKILAKDHPAMHPVGMLQRLTARLGGPVIRQAIRGAMQVLGQQFVLGRTMREAIKRSKAGQSLGYTYSYDMLGEAAITFEDADRYFKAYQEAIEALDDGEHTLPLEARPGISVKLSALHPRFVFGQREACVPVLKERVKALALQARAANLSLTLDAEEVDRLDLSMDVLEGVFLDPALAGWSGLGLAIQAYQKRALPLIDWVVALAQQAGKCMMVRLIKGAYWDTEIKLSQVHGHEDYPVFTRKATTDLSYLVCAQRLIEAGDAVYPQFGTHNAMTVASVMDMMTRAPHQAYEFQCLHGMGQTLYDHLLRGEGEVRCRVYAPVGSHEDLLPYLVRRLLENGANSSFVHAIIDERIPVDDIVADPVDKVRHFEPKRHPAIPLPSAILGDRVNSQGLDLADVTTVEALARAMDQVLARDTVEACPIVSGRSKVKHRQPAGTVTCPFNRQIEVAPLYTASAEDVEEAIQAAQAAHHDWSRRTVASRAQVLRRAADCLEEDRAGMMALCIQEAGKTWSDAHDEVREAVDFLRYYADLAEDVLTDHVCPGPTGERNTLRRVGRGVMLCISPWNFPLAIFTGQVAAALVAGNTVLAKPADTTVAVACRMVKLLLQAGVPSDALHLLPGPRDRVGEPLVADERVDGVMMTGSTATAKAIQRNLAKRTGPIVPLVAETGGQNAMIVGSTALPEQVVNDVVESAFKSAGQRCSALRVLWVQEDIADRIETLLRGAMDALSIGPTDHLGTDVGPVIDEASLQRLEDHDAYLQGLNARLIHRCELPAACEQGTFFAPRAYAIASLDQLRGEVFGPVLHVLRFKRRELPKVINAINQTGYGLTLGIQSRVQSTIDQICAEAKVGNIYVNRNMIGAVVGVQPFGGEGLSGTGPKAGGPFYLHRLCKERTVTVNTTAIGGNATLLSLEPDALGVH